MIRTLKILAVALCLLSTQFAYARTNPCSSQECVKPQPCPPKPCKPCPPVCLERGYPDTNCCMTPAYNEPASFELGPCQWNVWLDASFTYWVAEEEGLDLATSASTVSGTQLVTDAVLLLQNTQWKPGFKIGLGADLNHDNWSGYAEYTWFRSKTTTNASAPNGPSGSTYPIWIINNWALGTAYTTQVSSKWHLGIDLLDVGVMRPFYQGTHLIIAPFGGLRATWIRQNLRIAIVPFSKTPSSVRPSAVFHSKADSWAVGPRGGLQGRWHLGYGFRVEGDAGATLSFTRYPTIACKADPVTVAAPTYRSSKYHNYDCIRFNNDVNIGLGWGDYFDCRNYHFDVLLTYDFQIFWNQNMQRQLVDHTQAVGGPASSLGLQGLTLKAEFDF